VSKPERRVTKPPDAYLPPSTDVTVDDIIAFATDAATLYDVSQQTRLSRQTVRRVLRACEMYHEVEFGFGNDSTTAFTRLDNLRQAFDHD
jgi:response regulator of citrate/malate metabolism